MSGSGGGVVGEFSSKFQLGFVGESQKENFLGRIQVRSTRISDGENIGCLGLKVRSTGDQFSGWGDSSQAATAERRIIDVWAVGDVHCGVTGEAGVDFYEFETASGKW